jgi:D-alanyl-D-alanine carboxypeptidase/D-alanyl-D-alanine-endopeptidase (penicillin-binding protein 4)
LKTGQLLLVLAALLAPWSGARAQVVTGVPALPTDEVKTAPPVPVAPGLGGAAIADEVLPQLAGRPDLYHAAVLVERMNGEVVMQNAADQAYNPASAIKLVTSLVALRTFGAAYRFPTTVWVTGTFDKETGTVTGDLVVSGRDPSFHDEHAVAIARELNQLGIRTVTGDLVVAPRFSMNFSASSQRSGERFYDVLDQTRRPAAATRAWYDTRVALGDAEGLRSNPSVAVMGAVYVDAVPAGARAVSTHYSPVLSDVLKVLLCYSNNFMADRLGDSLGGPAGLSRFLTTELGMPADSFRVSTASGLGTNRMTPRQMMKVYRALLDELHKTNLKAADILPVAGIDPGTLQRRYAESAGRGSVIAKTGTLPRTDGGASALVGQMRARASGETLLFVILNQRGSVVRFRRAQDAIVAEIQSMRGGPLAFTYTPQTLAMRLADSEFDSARASSNLEEYEPTTPNQ